jgi:hypothetical protein
MEPTERCIACSKPADHGHHVTGRGSDHDQLDSDLTVPLCHEDHVLIHQDLRTAGIDDPTEMNTVPERIEHRLRRVATLLGRLSEFLSSTWISAAAIAVVSWANELSQFVAAMDHWNLGWRGVM